MRRDEEHWRPFEGRYPDGMPLVGAISRHSTDEKQSIEFPWCIHLIVHCEAVDERDHPTAAEAAVLAEFTSAILARLRERDRVIEAAHLSGKGANEYWWYVRDPAPMHAVLRDIAGRPELYRTFEYDIDLDADWEFLDRFGSR